MGKQNHHTAQTYSASSVSHFINGLHSYINDLSKAKGKVIAVGAIKMYEGSRSIAPLIHFGTRQMSFVSFTSRSLYHQGMSSGTH